MSRTAEAGLENGGASAAPLPKDERPLPRAVMVPVFLAGVVLVLFPNPPTALLALGVLWAAFFTGYVYEPKRCLYLTVLLMHYVYFLPENFRLLPGLNYHTVMVPLLFAAVWFDERDGHRNRQGNPLLAPAVFFFVLITVSAIYAYVANVALIRLQGIGWVLETPYELFSKLKSEILLVLLAPLAFELCRKPAHLRHLLLALAWVTSLVSVQAMWWLKDQILAGTAGSAHRAITALFDQPNRLGGFLAIAICSLTPAALSGDVPKRHRVLLVGSLGLAGAALLFSFSRGAWVATLAGLIFVGVFRRRKIAVILLVLALSAGIWVPESVVERAMHTFRDEPTVGLRPQETELEPSAEARMRQWRALPGLFMASPLLGHGYEAFHSVFGEINYVGMSRAAHSSIIRLGVEQGLVGWLAYAWLLWTVLRYARPLTRRRGDPIVAEAAVGLTAATVCLVVLDLAGNHFYNGSIMAHYWLLAGGVLGLSEPPEPSKPPAPPGPRAVQKTGVRNR